MSKAVLVIDMPKSCAKCPMFGEYYRDMICKVNGNGINYPYPEDFRQEWCPLRPMPEHSRTGKSDYYQWGDWEDGWNACIDGLLPD